MVCKWSLIFRAIPWFRCKREADLKLLPSEGRKTTYMLQRDSLQKAMLCSPLATPLIGALFYIAHIWLGGLPC